MKRPWPGGFFLAFSHNTILLTPRMQMKTPKSNSLTRKDWLIRYCTLWPLITAASHYFSPEEIFCKRKIPCTGSEVPEGYSPSSWLFCFPLKMLLLLHFLKTNMEKCLFVLARFPGFGYSNRFVLFFSGVSSSNHNTSYRSWSITGWGQLKIRIILITKSL